MEKRRGPTLKDVAERALVSKSTAAAVLRGNDQHVRVSAETKARILLASEALHYRANAVARSLSRRSTNTLGLYCGHGYLSARNAFLAEIMGGLHEGCGRHGKDLLIHGIYREGSTDDIYDELVDGRVDGLVLYTSPDDPMVARLVAAQMPMLAIVDALPGIPSVVVDDVGGIEQMVAYLVERGHRRVMYQTSVSKATSVVARRQAFHRAAEQSGLEVEEWPGETVDDTLFARLFQRDLSAGKRPSVVVCWSDIAAYNVMAQCVKHGVRVPETLAITGFDGLPTFLETLWKLTTIRAPWAEVARTAASLLSAHIAGKAELSHTVLPIEFVRGDSA